MREARKAAIAEIKNAVNAWAKSHEEAATLLKTCGGLRSLRLSCGNFTAAKLKDAATRIQELIAPFQSSAN